MRCLLHHPHLRRYANPCWSSPRQIRERTQQNLRLHSSTDDILDIRPRPHPGHRLNHHGAVRRGLRNRNFFRSKNRSHTQKKKRSRSSRRRLWRGTKRGSYLSQRTPANFAEPPFKMTATFCPGCQRAIK